jgi:hypothetical protein
MENWRRGKKSLAVLSIRLNGPLCRPGDRGIVRPPPRLSTIVNTHRTRSRVNLILSSALVGKPTRDGLHRLRKNSFLLEGRSGRFLPGRLSVERIRGSPSAIRDSRRFESCRLHAGRLI